MVKRGRTGRSGGRLKSSAVARGGGVVREGRVGFWVGRWGRRLVVILILLGAGIPFCLGKYFEINTPDPFDSSGFVYSAQRVLEGARIGFDEKPSAQIGTLWVNMLGVKLFGYSELGPKLLQGLLQGLALLMMFFVMRRLFGLLAAGVGVMMASFFLSAPFIAKFGNVKEQYIIACAVPAVCCLVYQQLGRGVWLWGKWADRVARKWPRLGGRWQTGSWLWGIGAGIFIIWAPLFKQTGLAVFGAVGLFLVLQPLLRNRGWRQAGVDILLVWLGIFMGLAPVYFWRKAAWAYSMELPHEYVWRTLKPLVVLEGPRGEGALRLVSWERDGQEAEGEGYQEATSYVGASRALSSLGLQAKVVFRFYWLLKLPISLALGAIVLRVVRLIRRRGREKTIYDRFVLLLGVWWVIDMVFVWVSPRSYEQYYLPLCASASMLGGYVICGFRECWESGRNRGFWNGVGVVGLIGMVVMVWPMVFGISRSPHHGGLYPAKSNGYVQKMAEIRRRKAGTGKPMWEYVAELVGERTVESDTLYVWGWYPGIYVMSGRDSASNNAVYGNMHSDPPERVGRTIEGILNRLRTNPPKFIIDAQKNHYPYYDHPNFYLWPIGQDRAGGLAYLPVEGMASQREQMLDLAEKQSFDKMTAAAHPNGPIAEGRARELARLERERHEAMMPLREFVMEGYEPVLQAGMGMYVFERKDGI